MFFKHLMLLYRRDVLLYVIFITGAVVLAVEVMAVRILAPFFGNTIFSFSSVVSIILAALSVGYWHGGRLADKHPDKNFFYLLVSLAGSTVIFAHFVSQFILPFLSDFFSISFGPLIATLTLFFIPSYFFGLLSPFVVKLRSLDLAERGIGQVSGEVFFSSTLGSILGSLLSGFVLIPYVGISMSMYAMGVLVVLIGVVGRYNKTPFKRLDIFFYLVVIGALSIPLFDVNEPEVLAGGGEVLFSKDGLYEKVRVVDKIHSSGQPVRLLRQDRSFSSGIQLPTGDLLFPYTLYYKLYNFFHDPATLTHALVLGAGTGTVAKEINQEYPDAVVDVVDIEPILFELSHEYFMVPEDDNIREYVADGRQSLRTNEQQYELIFGDMYSSLYSLPFQVMTKEYCELLYSRLTDGGVYVGNYISSLDTLPPSLLGSIVVTFSEVFDSVYLFAMETPEYSGPQNIVLVATKGTHVPTLTKTALANADDRTIRSFVEYFVELEDVFPTLSPYDVFTDDLAPVEFHSMELLRKANL
ncbi:MAG: Spermine synthase [Parcubacteria group bacterium GW2011_GWD2_42_14]|nr:MAG: Spermine synthase [Parcubacteria group bacterium GW2011_GWD2_42_14]